MTSKVFSTQHIDKDCWTVAMQQQQNVHIVEAANPEREVRRPRGVIPQCTNTIIGALCVAHRTSSDQPGARDGSG